MATGSFETIFPAYAPGPTGGGEGVGAGAGGWRVVGAGEGLGVRAGDVGSEDRPGLLEGGTAGLAVGNWAGVVGGEDAVGLGVVATPLAPGDDCPEQPTSTAATATAPTAQRIRFMSP